MKKFIALLLAMAMTASLAGCGSKEENAVSSSASAAGSSATAADPRADWGPEPTGTTEVMVWTFYGEANKGYLQTIADEFNASQDKYHVTIEAQGSQAEMNAKIQSTAQEDLPAMFHGAVENVAMYDAADYCLLFGQLSYGRWKISRMFIVCNKSFRSADFESSRGESTGAS